MARKRTSPVWKIPKEDLERLVEKSITINEVLKYFGLMSKGGNFKTLKQRLKEDKIDYSHFSLYNKNRKGVLFGGKKAKPLGEVMIENSTYSRCCLKKRLIEESILENKCSNCGLNTEWDGKKLVMVLDHINGISNDHRLENLRFLCPNCNSQTDTFAGRSLKVVKNCEKCGKIIHRRSSMCIKCSNNSRKRQTKSGLKIVEKPDKKDLEKEINTMPMTSIGKKYGVSDNAVRKWAKNYDIELKRKKFPVPIKTCPICKMEFKTDDKNKIYCSKKCIDKKRRKHYPSKNELLEVFKLNGLSKSAKKFNVSNQTIRSWLLFYRLPTTIGEIKSWRE